MKITMLYTKGAKEPVSQHFNSSEFDCPCSNTKCNFTQVNMLLVEQLEKMRTNLGSKLAITSGYRCEAYQAELKLRGYDTATGISQHELGRAADVKNGVSLGHELEDAAVKAGFTSIGVGPAWIHIDTRPGDRRWTYAK